MSWLGYQNGIGVAAEIAKENNMVGHLQSPLPQL